MGFEAKVQDHRYTRVRWERDGHVWDIGVEWGDVDGSLEAVGLEIRQPDGQRLPLSATVFRRLKPAEIIAHARQRRFDERGGSLAVAYRDAASGGAENTHLLHEISPAMVEELEQDSSAGQKVRPGRPKLYDTDHYQEVARIYSHAIEVGLPPTKTVMSTCYLSRPAAGRHISEARRLGYLPETTQGKVGKAAVEVVDQ